MAKIVRQKRDKKCEICGGYFARLDLHRQRSACADVEFLPHEATVKDIDFEDRFFGRHSKNLSPPWEEENK